MRSFEVCYTFAGFVYVYCLVHQSLVLFCFVFRLRSAVMFFNFCKIHFCFVFHRRSAVQLILVMFLSVLCSFEDVRILLILVMFFVANISMLASFFIFWLQIQLARLKGWEVKQLWFGRILFKEKKIK